MKRVQVLGLLAGCLLITAAATSPFQSAGAADDTDHQPPTVEDLIKQLGSDSFEAREEATRLLSEREEAASALRAALKSPDAETARRAASILDGFVKKANKRAFTRLAEYTKSGDIDQAVELFVHWKEWDKEDDCWQVMTDLNRRLLVLQKERFGVALVNVDLPKYADDFPILDFRRYVKAQQPPVGIFRAKPATRGKEIAADDPRINSYGGLFVASDSLKGTFLNGCFAYAGHSIKVEKLHNSMVVCGGDVTVTQSIDCVMIIARGTIRCPKEVSRSHLISSGNVVVPENATVTKSEIKENEATPLGFVKFFDPARLGLAVEPAEGGLKVKAAEADHAFAKAGLRAADLIVSADGKDVGTPDEFRRQLRRAVVLGEELTLRVRRGDKTLEVVVPFRL